MLKNFASDEAGQSAIEYALIISVVGLVAALGIMAMHDTTMTSLETMTEPEQDQSSLIAEALVQNAIATIGTKGGGSLADKLADLRKDKDKGNQGLALGHIIGNGSGKHDHDKEKHDHDHDEDKYKDDQYKDKYKDDQDKYKDDQDKDKDDQDKDKDKDKDKDDQDKDKDKDKDKDDHDKDDHDKVNKVKDDHDKDDDKDKDAHEPTEKKQGGASEWKEATSKGKKI